EPTSLACGHDQIDRRAVVREVENEKLAEAAGREGEGSGIRAAPVRARSWRCCSHTLDRYDLAHDCGELLANRSLEHLGPHTVQADVLSFRGQNNRLLRVADTRMDVVPSSFVGHSPRNAIRRSRHRRK